MEEEELSPEQLALVRDFEAVYGSGGNAIHWLKVKRAYLCFNFTSTLTLSPSDHFSLSLSLSLSLRFILLFLNSYSSSLSLKNSMWVGRAFATPRMRR